MVKRGITDGSLNCCLNTPPSRGKRIIILHAGSNKGWAKNALLLSAKNVKNCSADYHQDMDAHLFETWFSQQLLPGLPPSCVIVMDNAKYHSRQINKKPTQASKKEEIINFLLSKNVVVPQKCTKKELLGIVKNLNIAPQYMVDEIARQNGHVVLRLPPYYCVLNPIELVWSDLKKRIRRHNTSPNLSPLVVDIIKAEVNNITPETWENCEKHVIKIEDSYVSSSSNNIIINVNPDSEDDFSDISSDE